MSSGTREIHTFKFYSFILYIEIFISNKNYQFYQHINLHFCNNFFFINFSHCLNTRECAQWYKQQNLVSLPFILQLGEILIIYKLNLLTCTDQFHNQNYSNITDWSMEIN